MPRVEAVGVSWRAALRVHCASTSTSFEKELAKRTLRNVYNQRPALLAHAHEPLLGAAVAAAYGWADVTPATPDVEIPRRLLALNLQGAGA